MERIKLMRIGLIAMGVLILLGAVLVALAYRPQSAEVIRVSIRENEVQTVEFENLCLLPGESCAYSISLRSKKGQEGDLMLQLVEIEDKNLKHFAYVRLESQGEILCDQLVADAFADETMVLPVDFSEKRYTDLIVTFYMPSEVGNEAENAEAIFELQIVVSNE